MTDKILKQEVYCQTCKKVTVFKKPPLPSKEMEMLLNSENIVRDIDSVELPSWKCDGVTSKSGNRFEGCGEDNTDPLGSFLLNSVH